MGTAVVELTKMVEPEAVEVREVEEAEEAEEVATIGSSCALCVGRGKESRRRAAGALASMARLHRWLSRACGRGR